MPDCAAFPPNPHPALRAKEKAALHAPSPEGRREHEYHHEHDSPIPRPHRQSFDTELARLTGEIIAMGELAAIQLDNAIDALGKRDSCVAQRIVDNDDALDDQERRISQDVLRLLALRQPMARDLREVLAALRVASDIERIGDHATNIAENIWFVVHGVAMPKTQENIDMTDKTPSRDQGVNDTA